MLTIATAVRALTTEHSLRARPLVRVGPSTIAGAGLGVFANVALPPNELLTFYPGDAVLHWEEDANFEADAVVEGVPITFGRRVDAAGRARLLQLLTSDAALTLDVFPVTARTSIVADPELVDDPAYLSQYINDVRGPLCTDGRPANAEHTTLDDGARVGTLTTRRIEADEEVLVDYGEAYWEARR